ncbi:MAG: MBL fold metallo-hydrolase, partial [Anaerolineae bacterium]|nr:MBL fold metallo-hydrolase [Anaerolineae bacterium]
MLRLQSYGPVTRLQFSRSLLGRPVHWVSAYYVDGLLVDSGLYYTRNELVAQARALSVGQVFCTHQHEDHTGGVGALYRRLGLVPQAGADTVPHLIRPPAI